MTREENICQSCAHSKVCKFNDGESSEYCNQHLALTALRPVSREQVEKVWRGEWVEETYSTKSERNRTIHSKKCICSVCNKSNGRKKENFCPACGAPMTDEAVDMVIRRLEALYEAD